MKKILNSNTIKIIAIIAMTIDHIAWLVFPGYDDGVIPVVLHIIGRLTCPIMCYFIAEGYHYTKNINKYTMRLFAFAFISHFAYIFASSSFVDWKSFIPFYYGDVFNQTSVMWSLVWGLVMLRVVNSERMKTSIKVFLVLLICVITFPSDWSRWPEVRRVWGATPTSIFAAPVGAQKKQVSIHLHCLPLTRTPGNPTKKTEAAFFTLPPFLGCL